MQQLSNQQKLAGEQNTYQLGLMNQQQMNQKELAALAQQYTKDMYDYQYAKNTPEAMKKLYQEAGMNPALAYGMGATNVGGTTGVAAGQGSAAGGQAGQGSAAGGQAGQMNTAQLMQALTNQYGMGLQAQKLQSEIKLNESIANKNNAGAKKESAETTTIEGSREHIIENLKKMGEKLQEETNKTKEEGRGQFLSNSGVHWKLGGHDETGEGLYSSDNYGQVRVTKNTMYAIEAMTTILNTMADTTNKEAGSHNLYAQAALADEKTKLLVFEAITARMQGQAALANAKTMELNGIYSRGEGEWNLQKWGEFINQSSKTLENVIGSVENIGGMMINFGAFGLKKSLQQMTKELAGGKAN